MSRSSSFVLGVAVGAIVVLMIKRNPNFRIQEDADALAEKLSDRLKELEELASAPVEKPKRSRAKAQ